MDTRCPAETMPTLISGKWNVLILRDLPPGAKAMERWGGAVHRGFEQPVHNPCG